MKKNPPPLLEEIWLRAVKMAFGNKVARKYFENMKDYLNGPLIVLFVVRMSVLANATFTISRQNCFST